MGEEVKKRKYQFESKIKLPDMQEILDAASDFTPPSDKKLEVSTTPEMAPEKKSVMDLAHMPNISKEQAELQKLGMEVADAEIRRAKEKEMQRAEELRRLCREREELAKKKAEEEQKLANEEMKKAIQAAREKAQARKDAAAAEAEEEQKAQEKPQEDLSIDEQIDNMAYPEADTGFKMPPIIKEHMDKNEADEASEQDANADEPAKEASVMEEPAREESKPEEETMVDISELAINPFDDKPMQYRPVKEKEEFKETVLEDDYKEKMDLREDTSESVDESFLDF